MANANAALFDGANDYLARSNLVGVSDGKQALFSGWFDLAGTPSSRLAVFSISNARFRVAVDPDAKVRINGNNGSGSQILGIETAATFSSSDGWVHVLMSVDMSDTGKRHLYINDSSDLVVNTYTNDSIDFAPSSGDTNVGGTNGGLNLFDGGLSELWFDTTYLDLSIEGNRRRFITSDGKAVSQGENGDYATGSQPLMYIDGDHTNFEQNGGSGGNFTVTGSLASTTGPELGGSSNNLFFGTNF